MHEEMQKQVCVATGVIVFKGDKIFLTQRNVIPFHDCWVIPGGHLDLGETAEGCAKRELFEETGIKAKLKFFRYQDEFIPGRNYTHHLVMFFCTKWDNKMKIKIQPNEVKNSGFFTLQEIRKLKTGFKHIEIIEKFFSSGIMKKRDKND